jgi:hypothetical protein
MQTSTFFMSYLTRSSVADNPKHKVMYYYIVGKYNDLFVR